MKAFNQLSQYNLNDIHNLMVSIMYGKHTVAKDAKNDKSKSIIETKPKTIAKSALKEKKKLKEDPEEEDKEEK